MTRSQSNSRYIWSINFNYLFCGKLFH